MRNVKEKGLILIKKQLNYINRYTQFSLIKLFSIGCKKISCQDRIIKIKKSFCNSIP